MCFRITTLIITICLFCLSATAQPQANLSDLLGSKELDPRATLEAQRVARAEGLPVSLYLHEGVIIEVLALKEGRPVYGVMTNLAHPLDGGRTAYYEDLIEMFDLSAAVVLQNSPVLLQGKVFQSQDVAELLLIPDWSNDKVMAFDALTGNPVDTSFIPSSPGILASPKEALLSPHGTITVSDQITDAVQGFDTSGAYLGIFAPAGGVNTSILDNIRGHAYRPNGNLVVAVASGANAHSLAQFDSTGNYIGNFIANGSGGLNGPFGILFRTGDLLVSQSSAPTGVKQYDLNGGYLAQWTTISTFPQQIIELQDGRIAVANFSGTGNTGIRLYQSDGTFIRLLSGVTGNRGVAQIANGNFLTTNSTGLHEIDSTTGSLVRTILAGTNLQYITRYTPDTTSTGAPDPTSGKPSKLVLEQNYPNPFNPTTRVGYVLPKTSRVVLTIYDVLGKEIIRLVDEERSAGAHQHSWDGRNASGVGMGSGVYFVKLEGTPLDGAGKAIRSGKMLLLK